MKNLLLLSSSRAKDSGYLETALADISETLEGLDSAVFIPYAGVSISYDEYTVMVQSALSSLNKKIRGLHEFDDPTQAIEQAQAILVGGGNTFHLLHEIYRFGLIDPIQEKVNGGTPYIGWSAGSNISGKSIRTTNDMPIIEPKSFDALNLAPFQLNPHYTDYNPPEFHGETRDMRLEEFMQVEPETPILAIREGTALRIRHQHMTLIGPEPGFAFKGGQKVAIQPQQDLSQYLHL
ncbi:dipeptidase PepE [Algicola sagamiensis]|uniref:dipeptidase PepE n=1 Tax=Algicola sagamiensis TaxID=163869 RepID=UPI0003619CCE|nr:dipeptidase PepE [Algicola sagamiensis]